MSFSFVRKFSTLSCRLSILGQDKTEDRPGNSQIRRMQNFKIMLLTFFIVVKLKNLKRC